jgi:hypothetical protein
MVKNVGSGHLRHSYSPKTMTLYERLILITPSVTCLPDERKNGTFLLFSLHSTFTVSPGRINSAAPFVKAVLSNKSLEEVRKPIAVHCHPTLWMAKSALLFVIEKGKKSGLSASWIGADIVADVA